MLINHLLLPHGVHHDDEIVKSPHGPLDLESVHKMYRHSDTLLTHLVEEIILKIDRFCRHA